MAYQEGTKAIIKVTDDGAGVNVEKIKELQSLHKVKFNQFIRYQNLYSDSPTHDWYENYVIIFIAFSIAALIIIAIVKILLKKNSRHRRK